MPSRFFSPSRLSIIFYSLWFAVTLLQACFTELWHDEALYWMYSERLDWGFFYQPPMSALWIAIGDFFFDGELAVRLVPVVAGVLGIWFIEQIVRPKNQKLFYAIIASLGVFHVAGILAVPDAPLFFFATTFIFLLKKYLEKDSWLLGLLIGVNVALLLYSKYHGVLIVGFALLANLSLFKRGSLYLALITFVACFAPHALWQVDNGYPSIIYHLFDRSNAAWSIGLTFNYLGSQLILPGPLLGFVLIPAALIYKPGNQFERTLKVCMIGIWFFFFILSLRGRVEANWTMTAFIPLLALAYQFLEQRAQWRRWVWRLLPYSLVIAVFARIYCCVDFLPEGWIKTPEWHKTDEWTGAMAKFAGDKPLVFLDSYQKTAKYIYYTGKPAYNVTTPKGARGDWYQWELEDQLRGKDVIMLFGVGHSNDAQLKTTQGNYLALPLKDFHSYSRYRVKSNIQEVEVQPSSTLSFELELTSPEAFLESKYQAPPMVGYLWLDRGVPVLEGFTNIVVEDAVNQGVKAVNIPAPSTSGDYELFFGVKVGNQIPMFNNARPIKVGVR
jgi:hypothetical protein